jgi:hypothetical protein
MTFFLVVTKSTPDYISKEMPTYSVFHFKKYPLAKSLYDEAMLLVMIFTVLQTTKQVMQLGNVVYVLRN